MEDRTTTYLDLVKACDNFPYDEGSKYLYYELFLPHDESPHGYLRPEVVQKMPWTTDFKVQHEQPRSVTVLNGSAGGDIAKIVSSAFARLIDICVDRNLFHVIDGKHSEPFRILGANYPVHIERFASSLFGVAVCGACAVAYTNTTAGMKLWIPRRAAHLYSFPGLLDTTVAGGVKFGVSPLQTVIEESAEEASLPEDYCRKHMRATGTITCMGVTGDNWAGEKGLVWPDVLYVYDIQLPETLIPKPHDEEVQSFQCLTVADVQEGLLKQKFKPDAALVLINFFIQHGIINAENDDNYVDIITHLHRKLPFRIKPSCV